MYSKIQAVDLFCGAGGLTRGLLNAGIDVRAGVDFNGDCEYAYSHNNEGATFINKSVTELTADEVSRLFEPLHTRLLCGCAPCQTFSSMNQKDEDGRRKDGRWTLLLEFGRLVREVRPELVTMENVPGIERTDVFESFLAILEDEGYHVDYKVVDCSLYGMPQRRHRLVLLGSLLGEIRVPTPEEWGARPTTVREAIGSSPPFPPARPTQKTCCTRRPRSPISTCAASGRPSREGRGVNGTTTSSFRATGRRRGTGTGRSTGAWSGTSRLRRSRPSSTTMGRGGSGTPSRTARYPFAREPFFRASPAATSSKTLISVWGAGRWG